MLSNPSQKNCLSIAAAASKTFIYEASNLSSSLNHEYLINVHNALYILSSVFIFQHLCDGGGAQHPLPLAADAHHGALDQESLHPHPAQAAGHEEAPAQESHVSTHDVLQSEYHQ